MIKALFKYLAILCILLLSVSGQLVVNTLYSSASYQQVKNQTFSENVDADVRQSNFTSISPSSIFNNKENFLLECNEEFEEDDEDNVISQKRNIENPFIVSPLFNNNYTKLFFLKNPQALHFSKHFSHFSYNKLFIVFQVFRI